MSPMAAAASVTTTQILKYHFGLLEAARDAGNKRRGEFLLDVIHAILESAYYILGDSADHMTATSERPSVAPGPYVST